jgi:hypothetical protein
MVPTPKAKRKTLLVDGLREGEQRLNAGMDVCLKTWATSTYLSVIQFFPSVG